MRFLVKAGRATRTASPRPPVAALRDGEERNMERDEVPPSRGTTKAKREGRMEVGAVHTSGESGEPARRDPEEQRGPPEYTELSEGKMTETKGSEEISTRLRQIAKTAREHPEWVLTTLAHHIDIDLLREAYRRTRKDGAVGVDGQSGEAYARELDKNLLELLERLKSGSYFASPVRRVHIPKDGGKTRPLGIPTFEDKVLQRAVGMVLEAVYEQDFKPCSYGFRPGRSAHQALSDLRTAMMSMGGGTVIEVDIEGFFDTLDHGHLRSFLDLRVRDGVIRRVVDKWLKAGVLENGTLSAPKAGTPQGGVISPLLANIYLHHVVDRWWTSEVLPRLRGRAELVRYADDIAIACEREDDAQRIMAVLPRRFERYGLRLHSSKTRLVRFGAPRGGDDGRDNEGHTRPGTFDLLGFCHYWARSRKGSWVIKQRTARKSFARSCRALAEWCRRNRHAPLKDQHQALSRRLLGHYSYFGITGNYAALHRFWCAAMKAWRKWLRRRSLTARKPWEWFAALWGRFPLPRPRVVHSIYSSSAKP
jgi:RNA-directed DNA polymerase